MSKGTTSTQSLRIALRKYFDTLAAAKPQIHGIYWSRPQVEARQSESLTNVRVFLNDLSAGGERKEFVTSIRKNLRLMPIASAAGRRSASLGLSPHVDGGSVERWLDDNFRKVYRHVFAGNLA